MNVEKMSFEHKKYVKKCGNGGHVYTPKCLIGKRILSITYYDDNDGHINTVTPSPENDTQ